MLLTMYIAGTLLAGFILALKDEQKGRLLSRESGIVIWTGTLLFFAAWLFFPVSGTPVAVVIFLLPVGYHITAYVLLHLRKQRISKPDQEV